MSKINTIYITGKMGAGKTFLATALELLYVRHCKTVARIDDPWLPRDAKKIHAASKRYDYVIVTLPSVNGVSGLPPALKKIRVTGKFALL